MPMSGVKNDCRSIKVWSSRGGCHRQTNQVNSDLFRLLPADVVNFQKREQPFDQTFEFGRRSKVDSAPNPWLVSRSASEGSAKVGSAHMRSWGTQLQQNKAAFSVGCLTCEAKGGSAYMKHNASLSAGMEPQWQPKKAAFSVGSNREQEKGISQVDKETRSVIHEECKEFGQMFRKKLQEFAMILIKKYHYNFPVKYFDDYHGSFNKEEFLGVEWKKDTGFGGIDKDGGCQDSVGSNNRKSEGLAQGVWIKEELKEYSDSFGNEVPDEDVPNDTHGRPKLELNDATTWMIEITECSQEFLELEKN